MSDNNNEFKPFIPDEKVTHEFSPLAVISGIIIVVIFGGANAYLGLRVGMTVSASIPAAVISMGILRYIFKRSSVLENNMVQTIASAGESIAAGAIFTIPALFMWAEEGAADMPSVFEIGLIAFSGGVLGVMFMVPLRNALIVKEHYTLPYPEGSACAEVLLAGEEADRSKSVFIGILISAVYKFLCDGMGIFKSRIEYISKTYKGAVGADILPALVGVGYICGIKISAYLFGGGILAWLVLIPVIGIFGGGQTLFPGEIPINEMDAWEIWRSYIRYIGSGAVAAGGIISLVKSLPLIAAVFKDTVSGINVRGKKESRRIYTDLPIKTVGIVILLMAVIIQFITKSILITLTVLILGFFFCTVSSKMVGLVGSSNNPVSGMTIAAILIAGVIISLTGASGGKAMSQVIIIGSIVCIAASLAGDTSQDLKTGYILGATPKKQQIGEVIGVAVSAAAIGGILYLLNKAWGYGSDELPAPQAALMKMITEGTLGGNLPWNMVLVGVFIAVLSEIMGISTLPFAIGLYLPIHLSTPIMAGSVIRLILDKNKEKFDSQKGTLYCSGFIAGEGIMGIVLAVLAVVPFGEGTLAERLNLNFNLGNILSLVIFAALLASIIYASKREGKIKK